MNRLLFILVALLCISAFTEPIRACQALTQERAKFLDALDEKIRRDFEEMRPGWKHERVEPIVKIENVLIEFWSKANKKVKVSILPHESAEKAHEVFKNFDRYSPNKQVLNDLGDEAIGWGYGSADVAFRRGKFTVYISGGVDISADPDYRSMSETERIEREKSEAARLNREFAKHIVRVLDAP
jgi:hypothetical protein